MPFRGSSSGWRFVKPLANVVRWSGTDAAMTELAKKNAVAIGAGHSFIVCLGDGFYPLDVLNAGLPPKNWSSRNGSLSVI